MLITINVSYVIVGIPIWEKRTLWAFVVASSLNLGCSFYLCWLASCISYCKWKNIWYALFCTRFRFRFCSMVPTKGTLTITQVLPLYSCHYLKIISVFSIHGWNFVIFSVQNNFFVLIEVTFCGSIFFWQNLCA